jgi:hypothetical protein
MAFGITLLSIMTLCTTTLSILAKNTALRKKILSITTQVVRFIVMLIVVVLTFTMLSVIVLSLVMPSVVIQSVIILVWCESNSDMECLNLLLTSFLKYFIGTTKKNSNTNSNPAFSRTSHTPKCCVNAVEHRT